ncbi:hypothetical protein ACFLR7_02395, partial [Acidobacteriota bacterium]
PRWRPIGPNGGNVIGVVVNHEDPTEMFCLAGISFSGYCQLYISTNSGKKWKSRAILDQYCYDLAMDPKDPAVLYILASKTLLRSTDSGITWEEIQFGHKFSGGNGEICIHPLKSRIIYVGGATFPPQGGAARPAVSKTKNAGETWELQWVNPNATFGSINCVAIDPEFPQIVWVGGFCLMSGLPKSGLYKTTNGGKNWTFKDSGLHTWPYDIAIDSTIPNRMFVSSQSEVRRSFDRGETWEASQSSVSGYSLIISKTNPNELYAAHREKFYKSRNGGATWTTHIEGLSGNNTDLIQVENDLFFASTAGLFRSDDGGLSWQPRYKGIRADRIYAIAKSATAPNIMYSAARDNALYRSTKKGVNWKKLPHFEYQNSILAINVNPKNADELFILARGRVDEEVYNSVDGGKTWRDLFHTTAFDMAVSTVSFGRIYLAGRRQHAALEVPALHKSTNGGKTWTSHTILIKKGSATVVALDPTNDDVIYVGVGAVVNIWPMGFVFKSTDGGTNWQELDPNTFREGTGYVHGLVVDPTSSNIVYAMKDYEVYRSEDFGSSWTEITPAYAYQLRLSTLLVNPLTNRKLYMATNQGIYYSGDSGGSWQVINKNLAIPIALCLEINPLSGFLYVGTDGGGIYRCKTKRLK